MYLIWVNMFSPFLRGNNNRAFETCFSQLQDWTCTISWCPGWTFYKSLFWGQTSLACMIVSMGKLWNQVWPQRSRRSIVVLNAFCHQVFLQSWRMHLPLLAQPCSTMFWWLRRLLAFLEKSRDHWITVIFLAFFEGCWVAWYVDTMSQGFALSAGWFTTADMSLVVTCWYSQVK